MTTLKNNAKVSATHMRSDVSIDGKIVDIRETVKGNWYEIKPDEKTLKNFSTRAACITLR